MKMLKFSTVKFVMIVAVCSFLAACGHSDKAKFIGHWHGESKSVFFSKPDSYDFYITDNGDNLKLKLVSESNTEVAYGSIKNGNSLVVNNGADILQYDKDTKSLRDQMFDVSLKKVN